MRTLKKIFFASYHGYVLYANQWNRPGRFRKNRRRMGRICHTKVNEINPMFHLPPYLFQRFVVSIQCMDGNRVIA